MAIEKMTLVRASGRLELLGDYLAAVSGSNLLYHPEEALSYLSASLGYTAVVTDNPHTAVLESVKELADLSGVKLEMVSSEEALLTSENEDELAYLNSLKSQVLSHSAERKALLEQKQTCEEYIDKLKHFTGLDAGIDDLLSCEFLVVRFGRIPKDSFGRLSAYENNPYVMFTKCSEDKFSYWGVYCAPREKIDEVDRIFASLYFEQLQINSAVGTAEEIIESIQDNIDIIAVQIANLDDEIAVAAVNEKKHLNTLYTRLTLKSEGVEMQKYAARHNDDFYCVGWIPQKQQKKFAEYMGKLDGVEIEFEQPNPADKHKPPTRLKNPKIFRPFEYYVEMYGMPTYGGVDITAFVAITYTVIFGMMFGDLGQGFVLMIAGWLMWKIKKMALGKILIPCGASSMVFGLLFGSFFGYEHLLDPLYHSLGMAGKPLEVMESINTVLLLAISIGILLVTVSMLINVYSSIKAKKFGEAFFSNNGVAGILLYLVLVNIIVAFMGGPRIVPTSVCIPIIVVCVLILFFKEILIALVDKEPEKMPESAMDFVLQNVFEMLEYLLSYFSNTVSFLRVGAFVLVHAGMMMVVFSLAGESENIFVIILGNLLVICLEGLLTGIQALRLEFYEMFSRCFEGDGTPFKTIKSKN